MATLSRDGGLVPFVHARQRLFRIAYRILGSAAEAEDVVQDVWIRWQTTDRSVVRNPQAFLATTATRLAINVTESARARRETYVGPRLPQANGALDDPCVGAERSQGLELAVLLLFEKLTPRERGAYVLREAFDYSYEEIAGILRTSSENTRQIVTRARKHMAAGRRAPVTSAEQRRLLCAFVGAARTGDLEGLESLFATG
jgi:RNA polymerase sigma-70 factor (ECF subfamily)